MAGECMLKALITIFAAGVRPCSGAFTRRVDYQWHQL